MFVLKHAGSPVGDQNRDRWLVPITQEDFRDKESILANLQAKALEAQLAEATTVAARLQQANEELSARLEALEQQQMAAMPAPQDVTEDVAEAMQVNVAQAEAAATQDAAPMEEDQVCLLPVPGFDIKSFCKGSSFVCRAIAV